MIKKTNGTNYVAANAASIPFNGLYPFNLGTNEPIEIPSSRYRKEAVKRWKKKCEIRKLGKVKKNISPLISPNHKDGRHLLQKLSLRPNLLEEQPNCTYCNAVKMVHETKNFCCSNGDVVLSNSQLPVVLQRLLTEQTTEAKKFKSCVRTYNNHLAFTSLGATCDKNLSSKYNGIYTFRVQGQVYHYINSLFSNDGSSQNLQFYFHDTDFEITNRIQACPRLYEMTLQKILTVLETNPYARFFRSLKDVTELDNHDILLYYNPNVDQRVFNKPTVSQVAGILSGGELCQQRSIKVYNHNSQAHTIQYYYACYDPLQYPLMFPFGELGWHQGIAKMGIKKNSRKRAADMKDLNPLLPENVHSAQELLDQEDIALSRLTDHPNNVSIREYYAWKFQIRKDDSSFLLHFGRLFHQYVVDMFVKLETQRLDYFRSTQENIRQEYLQGIADAIASGENDCGKVGQRTILPASFIGGPRHMRKKYLDAMTLVRKYGKPDLFLTMTCNPNWQEVKDLLKNGEQTQDRPDLVARVFRAKVEELKIELLKKKIFGDIAAYTYVIEFQKRGLPHAHFLLILKPQFKLFRTDEFDKIVSAELPDPNNQPNMFNFVVKHMLHGPCGILNPQNVCMKKNKTCKNSFPKSFCETTTITADAYPTYRRRNDDNKVKIRGSWLDNRWVVPYNPYLLSIFDCHINVEICSTIKAVKYIYKYIHKGSDKILFNIASKKDQQAVNEIEQYRSGRWVCAPEAIWRIFKFPVSEMKPPVIQLQLHLENYQPIQFNKKLTLQNILQNSFAHRTMLTEYFFTNRTNLKAKKFNCTYSEFPDFFVWQPDKKQWKLRARGHSVGRIITCQPIEGERYYLRLLLSTVRCPESYEALRTVDGRIFLTYREASLERGLLQQNNSQELCLNEAVQYGMPYELRRLFATLLVYSCPSDPRKLWQQFERHLSEDYLRDGRLSNHQVKKKVLEEINRFLQSMSKDISEYYVVDSNFPLDNEHDVARELLLEKSIYVSENDLNSKHMLNTKQKKAFKCITERVYNFKSGAFFLDGPGGTGKTFLYRVLLADVRSRGYIALATASSGIAASLLPGGRTAHSRFKIPIDITDGKTCRISKQTTLAQIIREAKLIIWDEAPMCNRAAVEALDDLLRDIMETDIIFGGKVVLLGGDFRQTLPVVAKGTRSETINASLLRSPLWPHLELLQLNDNMRSKIDPFFTAFLLDLGDGKNQKDDTEVITLPRDILILDSGNDTDLLQTLTNAVFPNLGFPSEIHDLSTNRAILTTKNQFVDEINQLLIEKFPGHEKEYISIDETSDPIEQAQYEDMLNSLTSNGLPPHKLILKKGAPIILLRNLDPAEGLCNGTRMICKQLSKHIIHAQITIGDFAGKDVFIHRIPLQPTNRDYFPVPFKRIQFSIKLCFAMTINKSQGQTLDYVGVYLKEPVFSHGQLYVALSRARTSKNVKVLIIPTFIEPHKNDATANVKKIDRKISDVFDIHPSKKSWTSLIQVLERHGTREKQASGNQPKTVYRNYLFTDMKGVKVAAVIYEPHINYFERTLIPYKRYYISNAKVKNGNPLYKVGPYEYSWTISKGTLVEPLDENVPPVLPCTFDLVKFSELQYHADKNSVLTLKALVIAVFPTIEVSDTKTTKDFVIINEEKIPIILRVWNDLTDSVELRLPFKEEPIVIIATKLRVTTFDGLILCTRSNTYFMDNPPLDDILPLLTWYKNNKPEIKDLLEKQAYRDTSKLLPRPVESAIVLLGEAIPNILSIKTAWVSGRIHMVPAQENIWYTACANCNKYLNADITWEIVCTSCGELTTVDLRCRLELFLTNGSTTIQISVTSPEVEQLIPFTDIELRNAYAKNKMPINELEAAIVNKEIVCFLRYYNKNFRGNTIRTYAAVKVYLGRTDEQILQPSKPMIESLSPAETLNTMISSHAISNAEPTLLLAVHGIEVPHNAPGTTEKQFFSPTTKMVIEEISTQTTMDSSIAGQTSGVKRGLKFLPKAPLQVLPATSAPESDHHTMKIEDKEMQKVAEANVVKRTKNKADQV